MSHANVREALGAYTVGALDPAERARVENHLGSCWECRDELASFAALPGLLGRLTEAEAATGMLALPTGHAERLAVAIARARRSDRRRLWSWRAVAAAALLTVALVVVPFGGSPDLELRGEPVAVSAIATEAVAEISAQDWGMVVRLRASGLPARPGYVLTAVGTDEHHAHVASWSATGDGAVTLSGSCYMEVDALAHLEVATPDGEVLLVLRPT